MDLLFDIQTGISGDMILGALFDLGLDFDAWKKEVDKLGLRQIEPVKEKVLKNHISAVAFRVQAPHEHVHRGLGDITRIINSADLQEIVRARSLEIFTRLAEVEARIHGVGVEEVHFHELGGLDTIIDVVGACIAFEQLGIRNFYATPLTFGTGSVDTAHGKMAVPTPATLALSKGFPSRRTDFRGELCTPTGTAIVTSFARPLPGDMDMRVEGIGYGAGTRDLDGVANVLRVCALSEAAATPAISAYALFQLECNLDNMTPEILGFVTESLLNAGCKDAWQEPIFMKKNRAAVKLCALVPHDLLDSVLSLVASETSTGGVRYFPVHRLVADKDQVMVETQFGMIEAKKVSFPGRGISRHAPEYESCRKLALEKGIPLQRVYTATLAGIVELESQDPRKGKL